MNLSAFEQDEVINSDRSKSAQDTLHSVEPLLADFGVTRVANQTGFDRIGIPVYGASRPDAKSISVNQGKGMSFEVAQVSATMEAIEFAIAECPESEILTQDLAELRARGQLAEFEQYLPIDCDPLPTALSGIWGRNLCSGDKIFAPLDVLDLDPQSRDISGICKTTNGLASGNTQAEAVSHAICELIERDAETLWWLTSLEYKAKTVVEASAFSSRLLSTLVCRLAEVEMRVQLFNVTSDINIPTIMAMIFDAASPQFPIVCGYCCHPNAETAAVKALAEAAQSRVGWITGARDDLRDEHYWRSVSPLHEALMEIAPTDQNLDQISNSDKCSTDRVTTLLNALESAEITNLNVFQLSHNDRPFSVVKAMSEQLEDRESNLHWQPGKRANKNLQP